MKFLCDNCKAKYQIPDEKIAGRTLRMKCRKCGHNILIRGDEAEHADARSPTGSRRTRRQRGSASSVAPRPRSGSALGTDFRSGELADAPAERHAPAETEWHVAVNDVPVGPIKRAEVARKVGSGAVTGESLVWREGFDDWLPLRDVPELVGLLEQRRIPAPPPRDASRPRIAPVPPPPVVAPIGGRMGASVPPVESYDDEEPTRMDSLRLAVETAPPSAPPPGERDGSSPGLLFGAPLGAEHSASSPGSVSSPSFPGSAPSSPGAVPAPVVAPAPVAPVATQSEPSGRRALPIPAIIAMVGAAAFGVAFAIVLASKMLDDDRPPAVAEAPRAGEPSAAEPAPSTTLELPDEIEARDDETGEVAEETGEVAEEPAEEPDEAATTASATMRTSTRSSAMSGSSSSSTSDSAMSSDADAEMLTAEQQALLARLGSGSGGTTSSAMANLNLNSGSSSAMRQPLDANTLRSVVNRNRVRMQRCYELAIRGLTDPPGGRFDINIRVGSTGRVSSVNVTGPEIGNLKQCLRTTVGSWTFPGTSGGEASFPLVLSAGG